VWDDGNGNIKCSSAYKAHAEKSNILNLAITNKLCSENKYKKR
jgi:hypothetical protein